MWLLIHAAIKVIFCLCLTLLLLRLEYSGKTRSVSCLVMSRFLVSPGHQQAWHLWTIWYKWALSWSWGRISIKCDISLLRNEKKIIYFYVSSNNSAHKNSLWLTLLSAFGFLLWKVNNHNMSGENTDLLTFYTLTYSPLGDMAVILSILSINFQLSIQKVAHILTMTCSQVNSTELRNK